MNNAIFITFDDNFFGLFKACIKSIKENYKEHPKLLLCYGGSDPYIANYIRNIKNSEVVDFNPTLKFNCKNIVGNDIVYQRYRLWDPNEFSCYDNIIHLDCDTIVLNPLFELENSNEFFITSNFEPHPAVRVFGWDQRDNKDLVNKLNLYGLEYPTGIHSMANAGVFVVPKKYRHKTYYEKLIKFANIFTEVGFADQSIISLWCHFFNIPIRRDYMSMAYNVQPPALNIPSFNVSLDDIKILHFSGNKKPNKPEFYTWDFLNKDLSKKLGDLFHAYK